MKRLSISVAVVATALGAVALSGGCGGGGDAGSGGGATVTPEAACVDFENVYCDRLAECWPTEMTYEWGTVENCKATNQPFCQSFAALKGHELDPSGEESCATAYKTASCDEAFNFYGELPGCENFGKGTLKAGAACASGSQCEAAGCINADASGCGVCGKPLALGDSCASANGICPLGSFCDTVTSKCQKLPMKGDTCDASEICGGTSYCENGKCGDPLAAGAPCDPNNDACEFLKDLTCGPNNTCTKNQYKFAHENEACGVSGQTFTFCDGVTFCSSETGAGTCKPRIHVGGSCTTLSDGSDHCTAGSGCRHGTCADGYPTCN